MLSAALQRKFLRYDKAGEEHYNLISALHKSVRNSDADAALYWLARMLESGEDPLYVARRLVRMASEDIGLADPAALGIAVAAMQAADFVGVPEGNLALAQAAVYLALAPKSNALYTGYGQAQSDLQNTAAEPVPLHLRNAVTGLMRHEGYGARIPVRPRRSRKSCGHGLPAAKASPAAATTSPPTRASSSACARAWKRSAASARRKIQVRKNRKARKTQKARKSKSEKSKTARQRAKISRKNGRSLNPPSQSRSAGRSCRHATPGAPKHSPRAGPAPPRYGQTARQPRD